MGPFVILALGAIALMSQFGNVSSSCSVDFGIPAPKVLSHFGTKNLILEFQPSLTREQFETLDLYCVHGFVVKTDSEPYQPGYYEQSQTHPPLRQTHLKLECNYNGFKTVENNNNLIVNDVKCASSEEFQMYESKTALPDCENFMTLVLGFNFEEQGSLKNVALCYDIHRNRIKYMSYTTYPSKVIEKVQDGQLNRLGLDVRVPYKDGIFKQINSIEISNALSQDKQLKELFGKETYEYANLIQDTALTGFEFGNIFNIMWLRALRSGNWRHLLDALHTANMNGKYDVNIGVSGIMNLSTMQQCNESRKFMIDLNNGDTVSVPAHIWTHIRALQPSGNSTDEFVVIGHNSPFVSSIERNALCSSMCNEVDWLKDTLFGKLQNNPVFGLVQCCHVSDVADKLNNFPNPANEQPKVELLQDEN